MSSRLFAYGTLMPADAAAVARQGWTADAVRGRLFDLGPYPGLIDLDAPAPAGSRAMSDRWSPLSWRPSTGGRMSTLARTGGSKRRRGTGFASGFMCMPGRCRRRHEGRCPAGEITCLPKNRTVFHSDKEIAMTANSHQTASREGSTSTSSNGPAASADRPCRRRSASTWSSAWGLWGSSMFLAFPATISSSFTS